MPIADIPELMQRAAVPGVSVAWVADGEITPAAFGVLRTNSPEPVTPDTLFEAASLSKPVFAYAVLGHTTGWPNSRATGEPLRREAPPGERFGYSGEGFGLSDVGTGVVVMTNGDGGRPLCAWVVERLLGTEHPALEWLARRYQLNS